MTKRKKSSGVKRFRSLDEFERAMFPRRSATQEDRLVEGLIGDPRGKLSRGLLNNHRKTSS